MKIFGPRLRTLSLLSNVINSILIAYTEKQNLIPTSVLGINLSSKTAEYFNAFTHYTSQQSNHLKNTNVPYDLIIANVALTEGFFNFTHLIKFVANSLSDNGSFIFLVLSRHSKQALYKFLKNYDLLDENILLHGLEVIDKNINLYNVYLFHLTPTIAINARILMLTKSKLSDLALLLEDHEEEDVDKTFEIIETQDIGESNQNIDDLNYEGEMGDEIKFLEHEHKVENEMEDYVKTEEEVEQIIEPEATQKNEYFEVEPDGAEKLTDEPFEGDDQTEEIEQDEKDNYQENEEILNQDEGQDYQVENELDDNEDEDPELQEVSEQGEENIDEEVDTDSDFESGGEKALDTEIQSQIDNDNASDSESEADQEPDSEGEVDQEHDSDGEVDKEHDSEQEGEAEQEHDNDQEGETDQDLSSDPEGDDAINNPRLR